MLKKSILSLLLLTVSIFASSIKVQDPYVRATPPGLPNSAAFMTLVNTTANDISVVSASSNAAKAVELHTHDMKNGIMRMYQVPKIDIKANNKTTLQPGGFHIMFLGLKAPLKVDNKIELTLKLSNNEKINIIATVKTVMGGMMNKSSKMSCGAGKCGASMKKNMKMMKKDSKMSCGAGKCGK